MNESFMAAGLASWKPLITAFLLPPTPLVLLLFGMLVVSRRQPVISRWICGFLAASIWLISCSAVAEQLGRSMLRTFPALSAPDIVEMRMHADESVAIVILGGGSERWAPEYNDSTLSHGSVERLRYGVWLSRQTGWRLCFVGIEALIAKRVAADQFDFPIEWVEPESRDTRENAVNTVALLRSRDIQRILLVTHHWHMERAFRNFESVASGLRIQTAPIGMASRQETQLLRWLPSSEGLSLSREVIHEWLGLIFGA